MSASAEIHLRIVAPDVEGHRQAPQQIDDRGHGLDQQGRAVQLDEDDGRRRHHHRADDLNDGDHIAPLIGQQQHPVFAQKEIIHDAVDAQHQDHHPDEGYILNLAADGVGIEHRQQDRQRRKEGAGAQIEAPGRRHDAADGGQIPPGQRLIERDRARRPDAGLHQRHVADELGDGGDQAVDGRAVDGDEKARQQNAGESQRQLQQQTGGSVAKGQFRSHGNQSLT